MEPLTSLDLAQRLVGATGCAIVQVAARNAGADDQWSRQFPTLDDTELHWLREDGVVARRYERAGEAALAFMTLCEDAIDGHRGAITGTIHVVLPRSEPDTHGRCQSSARGFTLGDDRRVVPIAPLTADTRGGAIAWTTEPITGRTGR